MSVDTNCILDYDSKAFSKNSFTPTGKESIKSLILNPANDIENGIERRLGINKIQILGERTIIQTSAKLLKEKYMEGLNIDNIEYALFQINNSELIKVDMPTFFSGAVVHKFDITENLEITQPVNKYIRDIGLACIKNKYKVESYEAGIVMKRKISSRTERALFYSKVLELRKKDISTKELKKYIDVNEWENILRYEFNIRDKKTMRKYFHLPRSGDIYLSDILKSNFNPLSVIFDEMIIKDSTYEEQLLLNLYDSGLSVAQINKEYGYLAMLKHCNDDLDIVKKVFQSGKHSNQMVRYYMRQVEVVQIKHSREQIDSYNHINEIKQLLQNINEN